LITAGRRRSPKGSYALAREDLEAVAHSNALLLWVPGESDGSWIAERFRGRAWIAAELDCGPNDRAKLAVLASRGERLGLPLVAGGGVPIHRRAVNPSARISAATH